MRWGVEYRLESGTYGLCIFSADDVREANKYVDRMCVEYGYTWLANLKPLPNGCDVAELKRLFPGYLCEKQAPTSEPIRSKPTYQEILSFRTRRLVEEEAEN